ncbi:helix-turn-helix domain-containing protein [Duganella sp. BuS-21]
MAGVSLGYVGSLERGQVNASLSKIEALAGALKVEAQWLLEG